MKPGLDKILTSIVLVTLVFGLFILSAILRIKSSWKEIKIPGKSTGRKTLRKLDLVFSGIFLFASLAFYLIFILNLGH